MRFERLIAATIFTFLLVEAVTAAEKRELHIAGFTGRFEEVIRQGVLEDFEKTCDCKVMWTAGISMQHIAKLEAQRNNPSLDLVITDQIPQIIARKKGLLAPLDDRVVTNLKYTHDFARLPGDVGVGFGLISFGIAYNEKIFKEKGWAPPTSWHDLLRPEFKGKVVSTGPGNTIGLNGLLALSYVNGGSTKQIDRGFEMLARLAPNVVDFVNTTGEQTAMFQQGAAWLGIWSDQALYTVVKSSGIPLAFVRPKEGTTGQAMTISLVRGAKQPELAQQLIDYLLSEKVQGYLAQEMGFGPVNKRVVLSPESAERVVFGEDQVKNLIPIDIDYVNDHRAAWIERFNRILAKK